VAAAQDGEQNQRTDDGNDDRAKTAEAVRKESEHPLTSSGDTPSVALSSGGKPAKASAAARVAAKKSSLILAGGQRGLRFQQRSELTITPIPLIRAEEIACGACIKGSIARPKDAKGMVIFGGSAVTSTQTKTQQTVRAARALNTQRPTPNVEFRPKAGSRKPNARQKTAASESCGDGAFTGGQKNKFPL
jgi:hypothetical protein